MENDSIITLGEWLLQPGGCYVRTWEQQQFDRLTADIFGYNAVQIGLPQIDTLAASRMPNKWLTDTLPIAAHTRSIVLLHDFEELPFATQSLDLVVLPHILEFVAEPHQVLREVERVLIPEGQLIISGFNPASLWGIRQVLGQLYGNYYLPKNDEFISLPRLKDWLKLLNMQPNRSFFGCYAPPCQSEKWLNRFVFMEKIGSRWWPYFGAVYFVQAIKRVTNIRLVGPIWNRKSRLAPQGAIVKTNAAANHLHDH